MTEEWIAHLHRREVKVAVGASTTRALPRGTVDVVRNFLNDVDPRRFCKATQNEFLRELDIATAELMKRMPDGGQHWGFARKFLNIFLRGCAYNKHLFQYYQLESIEPWLEIPLDRLSANGIAREWSEFTEKDCLLREWRTISTLTPNDSATYQHCAKRIAKIQGVNPIDLDAKFWS